MKPCTHSLFRTGSLRALAVTQSLALVVAVAPTSASAENAVEPAADATFSTDSAPAAASVEASAQPAPVEPAVVEPAPPPAVEPVVAPPPPPAPTVAAPPPPAATDDTGLSAETVDEGRSLRVAGGAALATGGVLGVTGLALIIGFSARGSSLQSDARRAEEDVSTLDCTLMPNASGCDAAVQNRDDIQDDLDRANTLTKVGGGLVLGGIVAATAGAILYSTGVRRKSTPTTASIRVSPALGGAAISGRF